ncbi:thiamine pyrophosphate-dependent enzyme, partial [Myxococcota bacterium]|nr:thiamine pyrophosphate-dependent enzyme [Myxococcota bacterium]
AAAALRAARRPWVLVGLGALADEAAAPLRAVVEALGAPTLTTYKSKGALPASHPLCVGAFGLSSTADAVWQGALAEADLILAIGLDLVELRPQWLPGWPEALPLITIDRDPPVDLPHPVRHALVGDVPRALRALAAALGPASPWPTGSVEAWRAAHDALFEEDGEAMGPAAAVRATQAGLPEDSIVTLDVGAHRITAAQLWRCEAPNRLLQQNGLCSMGYGLPAAIAAKLTRPGATVAALIGDGGLWMTLGELGTAAELGLDLVIVYFSDQSLALIEEKQRRMRLPRLGVTFQNPEVCALAQAFGAVGVRVTDPAALTAAVAAAVDRGGLTLIEAVIDPRHYARQV